ncbi:MAG: restriction endonuclease, partial [Paludibacteraceae bacterium]|nr:restriction endonuclease [Paludibacteraceae bacterium]
YILCLDEMNLAPVEQYFAEYLSVVESRKAHADGSITTDPLIDFELTDAYITLINQLIKDENERQEYLKEKDGKRLTIPQNLFVIGTVNMDETTFSFSRKVLDRAMTIEMNEVNLYGGLDESSKGDLGYIGNVIIGHAAEGKDIYADNKALCDQIIEYLEKVNEVLEGTPFKIAYRTRNEFLLYAVNRQVIDPKSQVWQTLDEMTSMKILSRIEGDSERTKQPLEQLKDLVNRFIIGEQNNESISGAKIKEMLDKLQKTGYTSYWT